MRENRLKRQWDGGKGTANGWLAIPSSVSAEIMAAQGWDSITVDLQHGIVDYTSAVPMLQAISTRDATPMARVPWLEAGIVMKMLDAGAYGIICPMINTRAEAEALVSYCRYAPAGQRSFGPTRALIYAGADYGSHANDEILAIAMIETTKALDNLDDILAVPGLDGVYVGPSDLAISLGFPPQGDPSEPAVLEAISTIIGKVRAKGLYAGIHCGSPGFAKRMFKDGFNFASIQSDGRLLAMKAQEVLKEMGETPTGTQPTSSIY